MKMSHSESPKVSLCAALLAAAAALCFAEAAAAASNDISQVEQKVTVSKCCPVDSVLLESSRGGPRECRRRKELVLGVARAKWHPVFFELATGTEVAHPDSYALRDRLPDCREDRGEAMFPVYHHEHTLDDLMLLRNGSLAHRLVHSADDEYHESERFVYGPDKYCLDDMIIAHTNGNETDVEEAASVVEFAYICVKNKYDAKTLVDVYVYPIGLSVSMLCLVATFLLYSFLPQLRDLTGKFILGICAFLASAFALLIVQLFGWKDLNVNKLVAELCLHASVVGVWLCLNCMGHHIWKIITSKSVFTRVTDGRRLVLYTAYVLVALAAVSASAVCVEIFVASSAKDEGDGETFKREINTLGWETICAFYAPVTLLLLLNLYFYLTAQRRMARQILYNRSMQHFQVNFDLYIKFLLVLGVWWLFFMLALLQWPALVYISRTFHVIQGPLIFCVAMCRTRVAFLFKKYFCQDSWCCCCARSNAGYHEGDFIDGGDCKELSIIDSLRRRDDKEQEAGGEETTGAAGKMYLAMIFLKFNILYRPVAE